jgi:hypothetical protein
MAVQPMRRAAEAAIGRAAVRPAVRTRDRRATRPAILPWPQAHRHGAEGGASHQRQHHTTRAFHGWDPALRLSWGTSVSITSRHGSKRKPVAFTASCSESISRRRSRRRAKRSRSHRAARRANRNRMCLTMNGSRRNRSSSSCCATSCRWSRHDLTKNCVTSIRYCLAGATARRHLATARNCGSASAYRRRCRPQTYPSAAAQHGPNVSPAAERDAAMPAPRPVCACRNPCLIYRPWSVDHAGGVEGAGGERGQPEPDRGGELAGSDPLR